MAIRLLAHQGGWDEALLVAVPIVVIVALLVLVTRRARAIERRREGDPTSGGGVPDPGRTADGTDASDGTGSTGRR